MHSEAQNDGGKEFQQRFIGSNSENKIRRGEKATTSLKVVLSSAAFPDTMICGSKQYGDNQGKLESWKNHAEASGFNNPHHRIEECNRQICQAAVKERLTTHLQIARSGYLSNCNEKRPSIYYD